MPTLPQELQPERSIGPARDYFRFMQDALLHVGVIDKDGYALQPLHAVRLGHVGPGLDRLRLWGTTRGAKQPSSCSGFVGGLLNMHHVLRAREPE